VGENYAKYRDEDMLGHELMTKKENEASREVTAAAFTLAWRYEICFAGAACLRVWLHNASGQAKHLAADSPWRDPTWLSACMAYLLKLLNVEADGDLAYGRLADRMLAADDASPTLFGGTVG
jgi:hypothetical protein